MKTILSTIDSPHDVRKLDIPQLSQLTREIREFIIETVSNTGGHLAPSLGVVELTLVLHYLFNTPKDKIVWDVGHQAYPHKIITGRRDKFHTIRQFQGISGFPKISESEYDTFGVGHASTAISAAYGMACARDLAGDDYKVMAIVGDGALTGGLSYEGLNNAGASNKDFILIVNDNSMSISPNVGAMSKYLTTIISNPIYNRLKNEIWDITGRLSTMGSHIRWAVKRIQDGLKTVLTPGMLFEQMGFRYFGPIDGHNISGLVRLFSKIRTLNGPIVVHVLTKKGKGFAPAEKNASVFHGLGQFDPVTGELAKKSAVPTYTRIFGDTVTKIAEQNDKIVTITGAMAIGTGLSSFSERFPNRFFDVGIAEGHALTFAAGMATQGLKPVVAIYSSFMQRAYDQIIHDITLQKLPVILALDRAGVVGDDGPTHHGVFDMAFLRTIPGLTIMVPADEEELRRMLWSAEQYNVPVAIRYPRGSGQGVDVYDHTDPIPYGLSHIVRKGSDLAILAVGPLLHNAMDAARILQKEDNISVEIINARFVKPLDTEMVTRTASKFKLIMTLEEGTLNGGFGSAVAEHLTDNHLTHAKLVRCGLGDHFIEQGERSRLLSLAGLDTENIIRSVRQYVSTKSFSAFHHFKFHKHS